MYDECKFIIQKKRLNETLKYIDGHICKRQPTEVAEVYMEAVEGPVSHFRGIVKVKLDTGKSQDELIHSSQNDIVIDLQEDHASAGPGQQVISM